MVPRDLDAAAAKLLTPEARALWPAPCPRWKPPTGAAQALEAAARAFAEANGLKLGQVAQPLRAALTGKDLVAAPVRDVGTAGPGRIPYPIKGLCRLTKIQASGDREIR